MTYVYVISSLVKKYTYTGLTDNPDRRLSDHNKGYNKSTKPYAPFRLILLEKYENRLEARKREKYLKSGKGKVYVKSLG